jgi:hypothetical protein
MEQSAPSPRCMECQAEVDVPESYADGDQIKCRVCGTALKVRRSPALRLVLADVEPVRAQIRANQTAVAQLERDLRKARGSMGIGVNGLAVAVAYVAWQIVFRDQLISTGLILAAGVLALVAGVALEAANYLFLAKRREMDRLSDEVAQLKQEGYALNRKLREALKR